jgi:hypothetical protein
MTFPQGFGFQVRFRETGVVCGPGAPGEVADPASTFSNRDAGVLRWVGKYGVVKVVSSKVVKALVRAI